MDDVESMDAECEVDRVEILERRRKVRQVKREKDQREREQARVRFHAGRSSSPSLRLPVR